MTQKRCAKVIGRVFRAASFCEEMMIYQVCACCCGPCTLEPFRFCVQEKRFSSAMDFCRLTFLPMSRLEEITPGAAIKGICPTQFERD